MKRVFVIAMECEAEAVTRHLSGVGHAEISGRSVYTGDFRGEPAAVIVTGVGKVNAAAGAQLAIDRYDAETLVNVGVVGANDAAIKVADVFTVAKAFQCDFDLTPVNPTPRGTPNEYETPFFELTPVAGLRSAVCSTGDFFCNTFDDYPFVHDEMGATLREMEVAAIAHVAKRAGVRCCSIKAVSDVNYPGAPAPSEQYAVNQKRAVEALAAAVATAGLP